MRRRRRLQNSAQPTAIEQPAPEPVDPRMGVAYHTHNPMREDGSMPHDAEGDGFIEYLILQGMTEDAYWLNVEAGEAQALDIEEHGKPIPTERLTADQKGWAKADHYDHFLKEIARWRPVPGKDSKVVPWHPAPKLRDREYRLQCDDGDKAKLELWGYRHDLRELLQCQICGEVIIRAPFRFHANNTNTNQEDTHDQNGHDNVVAESDHAA